VHRTKNVNLLFCIAPFSSIPAPQRYRRTAKNHKMINKVNYLRRFLRGRNGPAAVNHILFYRANSSTWAAIALFGRCLLTLP
jgi:hypothetical protein